MKIVRTLAQIIGSFDGIIHLNDGINYQTEEIIDQTVGIIDHILVTTTHLVGVLAVHDFICVRPIVRSLFFATVIPSKNEVLLVDRTKNEVFCSA